MDRQTRDLTSDPVTWVTVCDTDAIDLVIKQMLLVMVYTACSAMLDEDYHIDVCPRVQPRWTYVCEQSVD